MLVLLSSTSFSVSMHYCVGHVEDTTLSQPSNTCEMVAETTTCANNQHNPDCERGIGIAREKSCCVDHYIQVAGQQHPAQIASVSFPFVQVEMVLHAVASLLITEPSVDTFSYIEYPPPPTNRDIKILIHSLLI
jgi:hypothetical protein